MSTSLVGPLRAVVTLDLRLQWRYGFLYATAFSIVLWEVVVILIPGPLKLTAMPYVVFGDSVLIGFFFIAGAVFFEKGERTLFALLSTPVRFRHYLTSKLATLSMLSLIAAGVVSLSGAGTTFDPGTLFTAVVLCTLLFLLCGLITAAPFPSMTDWLIPSTGVIAVLNVPLLFYAGLWEHPVFYLLPTQGSLLLLGSAFGQLDLSGWQVTYALTYQLLWVVGLAWLARKAFDRYVVAKEGTA
jgi:fluoroquinolone transport system permease protein